jgi:hypothetical protein
VLEDYIPICFFHDHFQVSENENARKNAKKMLGVNPPRIVFSLHKQKVTIPVLYFDLSVMSPYSISKMTGLDIWTSKNLDPWMEILRRSKDFHEQLSLAGEAPTVFDHGTVMVHGQYR